jgi:hypothetical protein
LALEYIKVEDYAAPLSFNNDNFSHQMDNTMEHALPLHDHKETPNNKGLPSHEAGPSVGSLHVLSAGQTLVIDPTGMFINELPAKGCPTPLLSQHILTERQQSEFGSYKQTNTVEQW